ncbi:MAG TPA: hypothetical protein VIE16_10045 [Phenylobacterium sp.]
MSPITETERLEALSQIAAANREMADRAKAPGWYHWTLGLLIGGIVAVQEAPGLWMLAYYPVFIAGLVFLMRAYKRHTGMWIPGYRAGRTRWVAVGGAVVFAGLMLAAVWLRREMQVQGACLAAGAIAALLVTAQGYLWEKAYRRDLGVA